MSERNAIALVVIILGLLVTTFLLYLSFALPIPWPFMSLFDATWLACVIWYFIAERQKRRQTLE